MGHQTATEVLACSTDLTIEGSHASHTLSEAQGSQSSKSLEPYRKIWKNVETMGGRARVLRSLRPCSLGPARSRPLLSFRDSCQ